MIDQLSLDLAVLEEISRQERSAAEARADMSDFERANCGIS